MLLLWLGTQPTPILKKPLHQPRQKAGADRKGGIVEVVTRIVQKAAILSGAVAEPQHGSPAGVEHEREIFATHRRCDIADDVVGAADLCRDIGSEFSLGRMIDGRG